MIVIGILSALFLDAAWEYRSDLATEAEYLQALAVEFEDSRRELAADQEARQRILRRTASLLGALDAGGDLSVVQDSAAPWIAALVDYRFFTPAQSVLEDLTASGNLQLVRSDRLRRGILSYVQERDRLQVVEDRELVFVANEVETFLADHLILSEILPLASLDEEPPATRVDLDAIRPALETPRFQNLAYLRWQRAEISYRFASGVADRLERLTQLMGEQLDN